MLMLALLTSASAAEFTNNASVAASYWSLGLRFAATPGVKFPLWNQEDSVLFSDTALKVECICQFTPAYARIGPSVTFSPIAIFDLSAHYVASPYFGTFASLIGFDDPDTEWSVENLDAAIEAGNRGTGYATRWGTSATLKAKAGPVIVAFNGQLQGWDVNPADNVVGDYIYEPELDLMIEREDISLGTTGVLLYDKALSEDRQLRVGVMNSTSKAFGTGLQHPPDRSDGHPQHCGRKVELPPAHPGQPGARPAADLPAIRRLPVPVQPGVTRSSVST